MLRTVESIILYNNKQCISEIRVNTVFLLYKLFYNILMFAFCNDY